MAQTIKLTSLGACPGRRRGPHEVNTPSSPDFNYKIQCFAKPNARKGGPAATSIIEKIVEARHRSLRKAEIATKPFPDFFPLSPGAECRCPTWSEFTGWCKKTLSPGRPLSHFPALKTSSPVRSIEVILTGPGLPAGARLRQNKCSRFSRNLFLNAQRWAMPTGGRNPLEVRTPRSITQR